MSSTNSVPGREIPRRSGIRQRTLQAAESRRRGRVLRRLRHLSGRIGARHDGGHKVQQCVAECRVHLEHIRWLAGRHADRGPRRRPVWPPRVVHVFAAALWRRIDRYRGGGDTLRGDRPARHRRHRSWCGYHYVLWNVERIPAARKSWPMGVYSLADHQPLAASLGARGAAGDSVFRLALDVPDRWHPGDRHLGLAGSLPARIAALAGGDRSGPGRHSTRCGISIRLRPTTRPARRRPRQRSPRARRRESASAICSTDRY